MNISHFLDAADRVHHQSLLALLANASGRGQSGPSRLGLGPELMDSDLPVLAVECARGRLESASSCALWLAAKGDDPLADAAVAQRLLALAARGLRPPFEQGDAPSEDALAFLFELIRAAYPPKPATAGDLAAPDIDREAR